MRDMSLARRRGQHTSDQRNKRKQCVLPQKLQQIPDCGISTHIPPLQTPSQLTSNRLCQTMNQMLLVDTLNKEDISQGEDRTDYTLHNIQSEIQQLECLKLVIK
ncbi:hypothetical protein SS50377_26298 [Spironucleus salmonicida]|uniref:Uncharacterized protein n=1 Tax=Spironucleus salmonicida TaxID=348837 RepID=V6LYT5_9EUKA|nr:hypothetical protein SS50377_26280 [Spironucleus salmonicida]KAH0572083.1 hypothetical protein SS50377_26290 [Spironucleus salmonicida]KAH0572091.1 hypothetical protein SS50377_26298 [Spironucleus salmonicida]|eukprot:EST49433.1 Hypothetical protein SS50377_10264 [Spironucleus salmonicida]